MAISNCGSVGRGKSFAGGDVFASTAKERGRFAQVAKTASIAAPAKQAKVVPIVAAASRSTVG